MDNRNRRREEREDREHFKEFLKVLNEKIEHITQGEHRIMSAITDLQKALADVSAQVNKAVTILTTPNTTDKDIEAVAGSLETLASNLNAAMPQPASSPVVNSISPTSGSVGSSVTISGSGFGTSQGSNTVTFNGVDAGATQSWSDTSIVCIVPSATTGDVIVNTSGGRSAAGFSFSIA